MRKKLKPKFKKGQVLAVIQTTECPLPRPRYIFVDGVHEMDGRFFYQDATVTQTIGWPENTLRRLKEEEAGQSK